MEKLVEWLQGKKTYIVGAAVIIVAVLECFISVPDVVYGVITGAGVIGFRSAVTKVTEALKGK